MLVKVKPTVLALDPIPTVTSKTKIKKLTNRTNGLSILHSQVTKAFSFPLNFHDLFPVR
jgi:hypothetical protein